MENSQKQILKNKYPKPKHEIENVSFSKNFIYEEVEQLVKRRFSNQVYEATRIFLRCNGDYKKTAKKLGTDIKNVWGLIRQVKKSNIFSEIV